MKKTLLIIGLTCVLVSVVWGDQEGESLARLYRRLPDIKSKYEVMQDIVPLDDRTLEPFLVSSLNELVYGVLVQYRINKATYEDWEILTRTIIGELGDIKARSGAATIKDVVDTAEVPLLKAEALISLGNIRAVEYAPEIATILRNLNFNVREDRDAAEIEAYGAVYALEKMREPVGFEPLFYASYGWYQDRVTDFARDALFSITEDPIPPLVVIMQQAKEYRYKRFALEAAMLSDQTAAGKTPAAVSALSEGLKYAESDYQKRRELAGLRIDAITALITLGTSTPESPGLLDKSIDEGDLDEKLIAIQALGGDGGDEATEVLSRRILEFNERQTSGLALNQEELILMRQLIYAMGETGNSIGTQALKEMSYIDYTPALLRLAAEALEKIQGN